MARKPKGSGEGMFLVRKGEIQRMVEQGYSLRTVYDAHARRLGIGYVQFTRYVKRYLKPQPELKPQPQQKPQQSQAPKQPQQAGRSEKEPFEKFHWNPIPNPEELF